ncbi:MAG: hypothetical protein HRU35_05465 [Rickettsiaceae bacterium]|nr:hypothetical protein [Rickettsiaceae bacterium]
MLKFIQKQLDIKLIKNCLVFALVYYLFFNSSIVIHKFNYAKTSNLQTLYLLTTEFIYIYLVLFIIFLGLAVHRTVFIVGTLFLFATGAIASYYLFFYKTIITAKYIKYTYLGSNKLFEMFDLRLIIWIIFSIIICFFTIKRFQINTTKSFITRILSAICLLLFLNNIISPQFKVIRVYFPTQYLHSCYVYFFVNQPKKTTKTKNPNTKSNKAKSTKYIETKSKRTKTDKKASATKNTSKKKTKPTIIKVKTNKKKKSKQKHNKQAK